MKSCKVCKKRAIAEVVVDSSLSHHKTYDVCGQHMSEAWDVGYVIYWPVKSAEAHTNAFDAEGHGIGVADFCPSV